MNQSLLNIIIISVDQRKALCSLANDKSIIIKEADKGGGIVTMNIDYTKKILEIYIYLLLICTKSTLRKI